MKPEVGGLGRMAQEEEFDPLDLLSKVAMLVLEARIPHPSAKGRVEGPHCSMANGQQGEHRCRPQEMMQCAQAVEVRQRIDVMFRNGIPTCVDILLFPDCPHGIAEAQTLDGASSNFDENALLLERWTITCVKKWQGEWKEGWAGSYLLQAVRSYLCFSQLSSWLASMHGHLPAHIAYRLYAPGDCGDIDFSKAPSSHTFPSAVFGPHGVMVTVLELPRLDCFPDLHCVLHDDLSSLCVGGSAGQQRWDEGKEKGGGKEQEAGGRWKGVEERRGGATHFAKPSGTQSGHRSLAPPQDSDSSCPGSQASRPHMQQRTSLTGDSTQTDRDKGRGLRDHQHRYDQSAAEDGAFSQRNVKRPFHMEKPVPATSLRDERGSVQYDRKVAPHLRKTAQMEKRRVGQETAKRPNQDGVKAFPASKRPAHYLPSPSSSLSLSSRTRQADPVPSKHQQFCLLDAAASNREETLRSQVKGEDYGKGKSKKQLLRASLESQLQPLELTPSISTQSLDLHSPKVLMSDVFYTPAPILPSSRHCIQLDFGPQPSSTPTSRGAGWPPGEDKAMVMQRFGKHQGGMMSGLEVNSLLYNLHCLPHPLVAKTADWQDFDEVWNKRKTTPVLQDKGQGEQSGSGGEGGWFCRKALLFGEDPLPTLRTPASTLCLRSAQSDPSAVTRQGPVTESAQSEASESEQSKAGKDAWSADFELANLSPVVLLSDPGSKSCGQQAGKPSSVTGSNSLKRASPELPAGKVKIKKKREGSEDSAEIMQDHDGCLTDATQSWVRRESESSATTALHSLPPSSLTQTLQEARNSGITQSIAGHKLHPAVDAMSNSWSSSSSSSSTYSSSPKVSLSSGAADNHSDSSTPTNLSASPLPFDEQPVVSPATAPVKPQIISLNLPGQEQSGLHLNKSPSAEAVSEEQHCVSGPLPQASASLSLHTDTDTYSGTKLSGLAKTCCVSVGELDVSRQTLEMGSCNCRGGLQREAEWRSPASRSPQPSGSLHTPSSDGRWSPQSRENRNPGSSIVHSTAACSGLPLVPFHSDAPSGKGGDSAQLPILPTHNIDGRSATARPEGRTKRMQSPCMFYLESPDQDRPRMSQWQRALDQDGEEDRELTSLLKRLCLQQAEPPSQAAVVSHSYTNGVDIITQSKSRGQSNGCFLTTAVQNGSLPCRSVAKSPSSLTCQVTQKQRLDVHPACDLSPLTNSDCIISQSSLVPSKLTALERALQNTETQPSVNSHCSRSHAAISDHSVLSNGAMKGTVPEAGMGCGPDGGDDSVFYDTNWVGDERGREGVPHYPIRTKSVPNFSCVLSRDRGRGEEPMATEEVTRGRSALREKLQEGMKLGAVERVRNRLVKSASLLFNSRGSVPSQSSPAPVKRRSTERFDYDETLTTTKAIKSAISLSRLPDVCKDSMGKSDRVLSTSAPASTNCLLGNFEESILNGRLEPAGVVDGFSIDIGASGKFCPRHVCLPVTAYFFNLSDDNAPSPYLGHISLDSLGKRGYHIPSVGTLQLTLFNPNKTVVKIFVVKYDLQDMPPNSQTVLRQRTVYQPVHPLSTLPSYLRYLIHLRLSSSSSGKTYLHTDIRLIFARHKFELDSNEGQYQLTSYTETPANPKYSPKR